MSKRDIVLLSFLTIGFIAFLFLDLTHTSYGFLSNGLKYSTIWLAFLLAFPSPACIPLFLTVICDYFLLFTEEYTIGVTLFCLVHLIYVFLLLESPKEKRQWWIYPLLLSFISVLLPLYGICIYYIFCFGYHIRKTYAIIQKKPNLLQKLSLFALFLFALCDVLTAILNITGINALVPLLWLCYTPSQALLALTRRNTLSNDWKPVHIPFFLPQGLQNKK